MTFQETNNTEHNPHAIDVNYIKKRELLRELKKYDILLAGARFYRNEKFWNDLDRQKKHLMTKGVKFQEYEEDCYILPFHFTNDEFEEMNYVYRKEIERLTSEAKAANETPVIETEATPEAVEAVNDTKQPAMAHVNAAIAAAEAALQAAREAVEKATEALALAKAAAVDLGGASVADVATDAMPDATETANDATMAITLLLTYSAKPTEPDAVETEPEDDAPEDSGDVVDSAPDAEKESEETEPETRNACADYQSAVSDKAIEIMRAIEQLPEITRISKKGMAQLEKVKALIAEIQNL